MTTFANQSTLGFIFVTPELNKQIVGGGLSKGK
jgi:hypothetical protein